MLELYHHDMSLCAQKVRFALAEKGLEWEGHYIDIRKGEQKTPEYLALNPNGAVPTLVHDGNVIYESNIIIEYLDDAFPEPPLKPADAVGRARVRKWTIQLDTGVQSAETVLTDAIAFRSRYLEMSDEQMAAHLAGIASPVKRQKRIDIVKHGVSSTFVTEAIDRYKKLFDDMEKDLDDGPWLVGDQFSLADIAYAPYLTRLDHLKLAGLWADRPKISDWYDRVQGRTTYSTAFIDWFNPATMANFEAGGNAAWPKIAAILKTT